MPVSRSASDKLLWYFYQFDRSILEILNLQYDHDSITLEWYEDIDIDNLSWWENIQVKYLTSQNILLQDMTLAENEHIEKPILLSFLTYCQTNKPQKIIWYYNWTQSQIINIDLIKLDAIIGRRINALNANQQTSLRTVAQNIKEQFIWSFVIEIVDTTYDQQVALVKSQISMKFSLTAPDDIEMYYDSSLSKVIQLVANQNTVGRTINKSEFVASIDRKEILFNQRFLEKRGRERYLDLIKKKYFTHRTIPLYERIFIIHVNEWNSLEDIKNVILKIKDKFYKRRENIPKPYFFLYGISKSNLIRIKQILWQEWYKLEDWYYYAGGDFLWWDLCRDLQWNGEIKIRFINNIEDLNCLIWLLVSKTLIIYEFYITSPLNIETSREYNRIHIKELSYLDHLFS